MLLLLAHLPASLICFGVYALDKAAARRGARRVPESRLLLIGLIGGWPGGLLAQRLLRHKIRQPGFQRAFWATVLIELALLGWLLPRIDGHLAGLLGG